MSELKIARFVDMNACKSIFSDNSTFVLRSEVHYRRLEDENGNPDKKKNGNRGDPEELRVKLASGGLAETAHWALSCWTMLDGAEPTQEEWEIFPNIIVAIISTPGKVEDFLKKALRIRDGRKQDGQKSPFICIDHKPVEYPPTITGQIDDHNIFPKTIFNKHPYYTNQKEYRFALPYSANGHLIDSYIFAAAPDYMEPCFVNPKITEDDKQLLLKILLTAQAGYGDFEDKRLDEFIANASVLMPNKPST